MIENAALASYAGYPTAFPVFGAHFHLAALGASDEERLEQANAIVWDWLGKHLRQCWLGFSEGIESACVDHLGYISAHAAEVGDFDPGNGSDATIKANFWKIGAEDYSVALNGGEHPKAASPFSYTYWAEIPEVNEGAQSGVYATLSVTVPVDWPLEDFVSHVEAIAAALRIRWGAAGLTYALWTVSEHVEVFKSVYAHARRHPGFDVGLAIRCVEPLYSKIRSVNHLTFLGPELKSKLDPVRHKQFQNLLSVRPCGDGIALVAGKHPEAGSTNHRQFPEAYRAADWVLRNLRLDDASQLVWPGRWDHQSIEKWLRRFE